MNIRPYLTRKNLLIATVLIASYVVILRWFESHCDPPATILAVIPPMCPESAPMPVAFFPLLMMFLIGSLAYSLVASARGLLRWATRTIRRGEQ